MHFLNQQKRMNPPARGNAGGKMSRRAFLKSGAALAAAPALTIGLNAAGKFAAAEPGQLASDFVHITADNRVIVVAKHFEAGQGPATGLATLVAEELNADWAQVETVFAPSNNQRYANLIIGVQGTGGSTAMANSYIQYRRAGAIALARLKAAAAEAWQTDSDNIRAENGELIFRDKRAVFGEMAGAAAALPESPDFAEPELKDDADFVFIGRDHLPRKDLIGKTSGSAMFAMDIRPDNLLYAVVARSPKFGGTLKSFDDSDARKVRGFAGASQIPSGVAVYGETIWAAIKARKALKTEWDFSHAETRSSAKIMAGYRAALDLPGAVVVDKGDADSALKAEGVKTVSADFEFPFLAHAPMEPMNCVIQFRDGKATLWDGCQFPGTVHGHVARILGAPPENVEIVSMLAGGTFGRRANPTNDYQAEAAHALKSSPDMTRPLKLLWTREDDIRGGYYRPMFAHRAVAGVDSDGRLAGWRHDLAGKSVLIGTPFESFAVQDGVDDTVAEGVSNLAYATPHLQVRVQNVQDSAVPVLWWRAVEHTHTAFAAEVMADMLAEAADLDPLEFRLRHLEGRPRHIGVLRAVADASEWVGTGGDFAGRYRGLAVHESFGSYVAQVAEVSLTESGAVKMEKVWCAVDCGVAVNPDIVRAQMEGGIGYGLGAAMRNEIVLKEGGEVAQSNFPDYEPLRIGDMPEVEVVIVKSDESPTGVGEPGLPPLAPALANAIYAATGQRVTKLPFAANGVKFA